MDNNTGPRRGYCVECCSISMVVTIWDHLLEENIDVCTDGRRCDDNRNAHHEARLERAIEQYEHPEF